MSEDNEFDSNDNRSKPLNKNIDSKNIDINILEYPYGEEKLNKLDEAIQTDKIQLENSSQSEEPVSSVYRKKASEGYSFWAEQIATNNRGSDDIYESDKKETDLKQSIIEEDRFAKHENSNQVYQTDDSIWSIPNRSPLEVKEEIEKKDNKLLKLIKGVAIAAVFGIVASTAFIAVNEVYYKINPSAKEYMASSYKYGNDQLNLLSPRDPNKKLQTTITNQVGIEAKTSVTDVVEETMPSIVTINSTFTQNYNWFGQQGSEDYDGGGSGIIVGKNDTELLIVTNNHVIEGANKIAVTFLDDEVLMAELKGTDALADLAVLAIKLKDIPEETNKVIKIAKLGDSAQVKVGEMSIAIGNALGYGQSTTVGYIGAKDREVVIEDKTMVLLQTDAAINPGNSGGALLNINGEVIGINTVKYSSNEVEGMGFAIPISLAMPIVNELMTREILKDEEKGYIGIEINDVTEEQANMFSWPLGVYVINLVEGGAAKDAGILQGDIITEVNGTKVTTSTQLIEKVTSYRYGTDITVKVMRREQGQFVEHEIRVTLGQKAEMSVTE